MRTADTHSYDVVIPMESGTAPLLGTLTVPSSSRGVILFAHGSGSSRMSPRNRKVASELSDDGFATLLFDLLTEAEATDRANVFDIPFLARRLLKATTWIRQQNFAKNKPIGYFGASTGGGAALWAAAEDGNNIGAVVSRGGRPDLAMERLPQVQAPTLLLVGSRDEPVIALNQMAMAHLRNAELILVPGAGHVFEEAGTLEEVSRHAVIWFRKYLRTGEVYDHYQHGF